MRRAAIALLLACPWLSFGQIRLGLSVRPSPALSDEATVAQLNILNNTGDPLDLGSNGNARVRLILNDQRGSLAVRWEGDGEVHHAVTIAPSQLGTITNSLNALYRLDPGSYTLEAEVQWGGLIFGSEKKFLEVVPGVNVMELEAGLPGGRGTRHFYLKVLSRDRQDHLFLRVVDAAADVCLGVVDLGRYIRIEAPTMRVDGSGYLHILHQSGPYDHTYTVVGPHGEVDRSSAYSGEYKVVRLKTLVDGTVQVNESASGELPPLRPRDSKPDLPIGWKDRSSPDKKK